MEEALKKKILKDLEEIRIPSLVITNQAVSATNKEWGVVFEVINETLCKIEEKIGVPFQLQFEDLIEKNFFEKTDEVPF